MRRYGDLLTKDAEFVIHREPVWRARANFIINAELQQEDRPYHFEQLWSRQLKDGDFEVCCIPFFVYDIALGDVVRTVSRDGQKYLVAGVVKPSGRYTFRVWFGLSYLSREEIAAQLTGLGALMEWSSPNLLAVDAANAPSARNIADYLAAREQDCHLRYETGRTV